MALAPTPSLHFATPEQLQLLRRPAENLGDAVAAQQDGDHTHAPWLQSLGLLDPAAAPVQAPAPTAQPALPPAVIPAHMPDSAAPSSPAAPPAQATQGQTYQLPLSFYRSLLGVPEGGQAQAPAQHPVQYDHAPQMQAPPAWQPPTLRAEQNPDNVRNVLMQRLLSGSLTGHGGMGYADAQQYLQQQAAHSVFDSPEVRDRVAYYVNQQHLPQATAEALTRAEVARAYPQLGDQYRAQFRQGDMQTLAGEEQDALGRAMLMHNPDEYNHLASAGIGAYVSGAPSALSMPTAGLTTYWSPNGNGVTMQNGVLPAYTNPLTPMQMNAATMQAGQAREQAATKQAQAQRDYDLEVAKLRLEARGQDQTRAAAEAQHPQSDPLLDHSLRALSALNERAKTDPSAAALANQLSAQIYAHVQSQNAAASGIAPGQPAMSAAERMLAPTTPAIKADAAGAF